MQQGLLAGAILADFGKGPISSNLPTELQSGLRLHRRIDAYSNSHETIRAVCASFPTELRRYAPIFVDILGDYYLSQNWHNYYQHSRDELNDRVLVACRHYASCLNEAQTNRLESFLQYMEDVDLLVNYHQWRHIERGLYSVLRRLGKPDLFSDVQISAIAQRDTGADAFRIYFSDMRHQLPGWASLTSRT